MITLSVKQPWAWLICANIKDIENRTWKLPEKHKGKRVLIHASAKPVKPHPLNYRQWSALSYDQRIFIESNTLPCSAIIGSVEIVDCVINHESIWAEETSDVLIDLGISITTYNWVLANPVLFDNPILNVNGKLGFWDYPDELLKLKDINK